MDKLNLLYSKDRNAGFPVMTGDVLSVHAYSSVASLVVRFSGYFRRMDGEIINYAVDVSPTSDRAVTSKLQDFGPGFLLSCTAYLLTGNANRGQCYARAFIRNSQSGEVVPLAQLIGGYVTDDYMPSFPFGKIEGPLEGPGYLSHTRPANPGAGNDLLVTVPTGARWRLLYLGYDLTTSATVADRQSALYVDDGARNLFVSAFGPAQAASLTRHYNYGQCGYFTTAFVANGITLGIPPLDLAAGWNFGTSDLNLAGGDTITNVAYATEEWIEA